MIEGRVLFVDDDKNILSAFRRQLRGSVDVETISDPVEALSSLKTKGPFAVIVADMQMPSMNGVHFLKEARKLSPDSVRMMLTGNVDQETAIKALHEGSIFQFLNKPVSTEQLVAALTASAEQYRLVVAEKELLQKTLTGSVKVLTDIIALANPVDFGNVVKLRPLVRQLATGLRVVNGWELELALMLSQIGLILLPPDLNMKMQKGEALTGAELALIEQVPEQGKKLIENIPRLKTVGEIIFYHRKNFDGTGFPVEGLKGDAIPLGSRIIRAVLDLHTLESKGTPAAEALNTLAGRPNHYDPLVVAELRRIVSQSPQPVTSDTKGFEIRIKDLCPGQRLMAPIETKDGMLLINAGALITESLTQRIVNYATLRGIKEPLLVDVRMPTIET